MGKQIKGRCRRARENFPLSTGKFLKKNRPLPWRRIAYVEYPEQRLKKVAGFGYVPDPLPMRNSNNAVVYYLFFASHKPAAEKIVKDIFKKYSTYMVT